MPQRRGIITQPLASAHRLLTVAFACLISTPLLAAEADAQDANYQLESRPSVCISYDREQPCAMALHLEWQGPLTNEACLTAQAQEGPLQCWNQQQRGEADIAFASAADINYFLQDVAQQATLASTTVKVINRDLRNSRKRRRHVWSLL
jgi:hypothetical protein